MGGKRVVCGTFVKSGFVRCSRGGRNRARNHKLEEGQGEGSDPSSSCVENVEDNKGER